jgi:hypothetical protein
VSKFHEDDPIEGNTIEFRIMDSSDIESASKLVEDMHNKNQDLRDSAREMEAKETLISEKADGNRALNASTVSHQMQANPHSSHQGRESIYTNGSKLDSIEVPIGESNREQIMTIWKLVGLESQRNKITKRKKLKIS